MDPHGSHSSPIRARTHCSSSRCRITRYTRLALFFLAGGIIDRTLQYISQSRSTLPRSIHATSTPSALRPTLLHSHSVTSCRPYISSGASLVPCPAATLPLAYYAIGCLYRIVLLLFHLHCTQYTVPCWSYTLPRYIVATRITTRPQPPPLYRCFLSRLVSPFYCLLLNSPIPHFTITPFLYIPSSTLCCNSRHPHINACSESHIRTATPLDMAVTPEASSEVDRSQHASTTPPGKVAFLVHSVHTLTENLPPEVDDKSLARQRRRRTR